MGMMGKAFSSTRSRNILTSAALLASVAGLWGRADDLRYAFHASAQAGTPLHQRDIIIFPPNSRQQAVNGNYPVAIPIGRFVETGTLQTHASYGMLDYVEGSIRLDWNADDALTKALDRVQAQVAADIAEDPLLQGLIQNPSWGGDERAYWDRTVSGYISRAMDEIPGLRSTDFRSPDLGDDVRPTRRLNDLRHDIANNTREWEFDCEAFSAFKAALLHRVADKCLTAAQRPEYLYVAGMVSFGRGEDALGHAYVLSHKDGQIGGIIEATASDDVFVEPVAQFTLDDLYAGKTMVCRDDSVYGLCFSTPQAVEARTQQRQEMANQQQDVPPPATLASSMPSVAIR